MLESENVELSFFALYPKAITRNFTFTYGIMLGNTSSEFRVIVFCSILKIDNSDIFQSTKAFNSENIVQVCLVSSKTHKANMDFSNSVKD